MENYRKFIYFGIIPGLLFQFIGSLFYFVIFQDSVLSQVVYTLTKILLVIWPLFWLKYWYFKPRKTYPVKSIVLGIISGVLISGLIYTVYLIFSDYFTNFSVNIREIAGNFNLLNHYFLFALFLSLFHSFLEEYYWRWFLFGGLARKLNFVDSALISSLAFGLHHIVVLSQFFTVTIAIVFSLAIMIGGFIWCWLLKRSNIILGSWLSHLLVDGIIMFIGYRLIF